MIICVVYIYIYIQDNMQVKSHQASQASQALRRVNSHRNWDITDIAWIIMLYPKIRWCNGYMWKYIYIWIYFVIWLYIYITNLEQHLPIGLSDHVHRSPSSAPQWICLKQIAENQKRRCWGELWLTQTTYLECVWYQDISWIFLEHLIYCTVTFLEYQISKSR